MATTWDNVTNWFSNLPQEAKTAYDKLSEKSRGIVTDYSKYLSTLKDGETATPLKEWAKNTGKYAEDSIVAAGEFYDKNVPDNVKSAINSTVEWGKQTAKQTGNFLSDFFSTKSLAGKGLGGLLGAVLGGMMFGPIGAIIGGLLAAFLGGKINDAISPPVDIKVTTSGPDAARKQASLKTLAVDPVGTERTQTFMLNDKGEIPTIAKVAGGTEMVPNQAAAKHIIVGKWNNAKTEFTITEVGLKGDDGIFIKHNVEAKGLKTLKAKDGNLDLTDATVKADIGSAVSAAALLQMEEKTKASKAFAESLQKDATDVTVTVKPDDKDKTKATITLAPKDNPFAVSRTLGTTMGEDGKLTINEVSFRKADGTIDKKKLPKAIVIDGAVKKDGDKLTVNTADLMKNPAFKAAMADIETNTKLGTNELLANASGTQKPGFTPTGNADLMQINRPGPTLGA